MNKQAVYIIGAGLSGATTARLFANNNYQVIVYEAENHVGGNCYDYLNEHQILVQKYGPHIFHTDKKHVYDFLKQFAKFNKYHIQVKANVKKQLVDLPINFQSIDLFFKEKANYIKKQILAVWPNRNTVTINELITSNEPQIKKWANFIYQNIYENYSSKMWGIPIDKIDRDVLNRVKITLGYDNNYFPNDRYQGMPIGGFSKMINKMLKHPLIKIIHQKPNIELKNKKVLINNQLITGHVFYCGQIDELFHYCYGSIPYRSLHIDFETKKMNSYQPASVVNYPAHKTMTRIAEYKKINSQNNKNFTTISKEYPGAYDLNSKKFNKPYYPIHNPINIRLYNKYLKLANNFTNLHLLGRLAEYKYFDMDDAIDNAMLKYQKFEKSI